jgi:hypothetical protein
LSRKDPNFLLIGNEIRGECAEGDLAIR